MTTARTARIEHLPGLSTWDKATLVLQGLARACWLPLMVVGYCVFFGVALDMVMPAVSSTSDAVVFHTTGR